MAKSKTGSFWLTEEVEIGTVGTNVQGTIDLAAYIDVGDQQAIAIEFVDFILQPYNTSTNEYEVGMAAASGGDVALGYQLSDLNPGNLLISADNNALIASATMFWDDGNNVSSVGPDLYPDSFGKLDESRMVVNDQLYLVAASDGTALAANHSYRITCRIKARIVKLGTKDWVSIAIQSTAADN